MQCIESDPADWIKKAGSPAPDWFWIRAKSKPICGTTGEEEVPNMTRSNLLFDASVSSGTTSSSSSGNTNSMSKNLRCHHCAGPLSKDMETCDWTVPPLIRDSFSMIGSAVGGTTSFFYGFNYVMPVVQRKIKGPMWLHFLIGAPPVIVFSSACAGLAGGAVPSLAQLVSSSYHAVFSSSSQPPCSKDDKLHQSRTSSTL